MFKYSFRMMIFLFGLVFGMQLPNFMNLYQQQANTHLMEAEINFVGFRKIATHYFGGDVSKLIEHHLNSADPVFVDEGEVIQENYERIVHLQSQVDAMNGYFISQVMHLLVNRDKELLKESTQQFSWSVSLNYRSILIGAFVGLLFALAYHSLMALLRRLFKRKFFKKP